MGRSVTINSRFGPKAWIFSKKEKFYNFKFYFYRISGNSFGGLRKCKFTSETFPDDFDDDLDTSKNDRFWPFFTVESTPRSQKLKIFWKFSKFFSSSKILFFLIFNVFFGLWVTVSLVWTQTTQKEVFCVRTQYPRHWDSQESPFLLSSISLRLQITQEGSKRARKRLISVKITFLKKKNFRKFWKFSKILKFWSKYTYFSRQIS